MCDGPPGPLPASLPPPCSAPDSETTAAAAFAAAAPGAVAAGHAAAGAAKAGQHAVVGDLAQIGRNLMGFCKWVPIHDLYAVLDMCVPHHTSNDALGSAAQPHGAVLVSGECWPSLRRL